MAAAYKEHGSEETGLQDFSLNSGTHSDIWKDNIKTELDVFWYERVVCIHLAQDREHDNVPHVP